ncbi:MAG: hypothetical protein ACRDC2_08580 [Plesiomonas shigelloides]
MTKYIIIAVLSIIATFLLRDIISTLGYSVYKDTLSALLNISSIIFAIIGAWIAIIYPRAIGRAFKGHDISSYALKDANSDANYLSELIETVMVSAVVLMLVLIIQYTAPVLKAIISDYKAPFFKHTTFFIVTLLTLSQLYAVFRVIITNYFFLNDLRKKNIAGKVDTLHH